jgi:hypothetical protein
MRDPLSVLVRHLLGVRPAPRPVGPHGNKCTRRNLSVFSFPFFHAFKREGLVRVFCAFLMHVDAHLWQNHLLELDLIDSAQAFMKMRLWIRVLAPT